MTIEVLLEQGQDRKWAASSNDQALLGCIVAIAATREEALAKFREDLRLHREFQAERGYDVPEVTGFELREFVAA